MCYIGTYYTAQVCLNGHVINDSANVYPENTEKFCGSCGKPTIMNCPTCNIKIRGFYYVEGVLSLRSMTTAPAFCYNCGTPYPWTELALQAANEIIFEDENLTQTEKEKLNESLPDIISETPKTQLASTRIKKDLATTGKFTAEAIRQFVIDFGCDLAKKSVGL